MPRTVLPDARLSPRFAGISTFCRYPRIQDVTPDNLPLDWAIYGVPFDGGVTYRPGARFGPRAIREESQYVKRYHMTHKVDVCDRLSIADAGDSPVKPYSCVESMKAQLQFASALGTANKTKLFAVGGDHSIAYANIKATHARYGNGKPLALVHFDSHLDTVERVWDETWGHASVFRHCIDDGIVDPASMISIGVKGPLNTEADLEYARQKRITLLEREMFPGAGEVAIADFVQRIGDRPVYITFDIDCVDPAFAPGTGTPSVGGFSSAEVIKLVRQFAGIRIVGADVVEVLPDRDPQGITSLLAAHIMFEILALDARSRAT